MDALGLDEVWWLVSPGNPLKSAKGMAPYDARLGSARIMARRSRIRVSDFEREADRFAYGLLRSTRRSPRLLGEALAQLENARSSASSHECVPDGAPKKEKPEPVNLGYLSTHPATAERIRDAEEAAR